MVKKTKIKRLFLLPFAIAIFLTGWCITFVGSTKKVEQRKKENYDMHIGVLESEEPMIYQPIKR